MTRNKLITKFYGKCTEVTKDLLPATLNVIDVISPDDEEDYSVLSEELNKALIRICEDSVSEGNKVYDLVLTRIENLNWNNTEDVKKAFVLLHIFSNEHLNLYGANQNLRVALRTNHQRILTLISLLLNKENKIFFEYKSLHSELSYGSFIELLINLSFFHSHYSSDDDLRDAVAVIIPEFYEKHPTADSTITFSLLKHHKQYLKQLANLIARYVSGEKIGVIHKIALDMMKYEPKLTKKWGVVEWDRLVERFLYYPFGSNLQKISKELMMSKNRKEFVDWIMISQPNISKYAELKKAFEEINEKGDLNTNHLFEGKGVEFKDFNFKLFVINELMYEQTVLQPKLDVRNFPGEEIDVEEDGYDIIPKVKAYFKKLVLKEEHLAKITTLHIGATAKIIFQIYPFWDGEDDTFEIKKIDDITHLPNLKEINFDEFEHLNIKFGKKLEKAGVKLVK